MAGAHQSRRLDRRDGQQRGGISRPLAIGLAVVLAGASMAGVWAIGHVHASPSTRPGVVTRSASPEPSPSPTASDESRLVPHPRPVPILVYHHVLPWRLGPRLLYVSPAQFAAELAFLQRRHYRPVTLRKVYDAWFGRTDLPRHPIVITFDDGYADQVRIAARLLRRHRWPAEFDLIFNALYKGSAAPSSRVTAKMVRGLLSEGWELESHSVSHHDLTSLSSEALRHELEYSRKRLQQIFDVPVDFLCYPGGVYNARVERAARHAGYLAATGTDFAAATPAHLYALPRIYCYWGESLRVFAKRLRVTLAAARAAD